MEDADYNKKRGDGTMEEKSLATELLREIKRESHRRFVLLIICIILLFVSNIAWLVAWNLPVKETVEETYDMQGEDDANVILNGDGEVHINEPYSSDGNNGFGSGFCGDGGWWIARPYE